MSDRDVGFTLIEIIVVVVLLGLVTSALSMAAIVMMRTGPLAESRIDATRGTTSLAFWLDRDVASVPRHAFAPLDGGVDVGARHCPGVTGGESVVSFGWTIRTTAATRFHAVDYVLIDAPDNASRLPGERVSNMTRYACSGSSSGSLGDTETVHVGSPVDQLSDQVLPGAEFDGELLTITLARVRASNLVLVVAPRSPA